MRPPRLCALRGLVLVLILAAPLALPGQAASAAPQPEGQGKGCKVVLLATRARGVPADLAALAGATLTEELARQGCRVLDDKSVAAMWKLLGLRPDAPTQDLQKLGRSLLSDWVVIPALSREGELLRVEVWALFVARLEVIQLAEEVPGEEVLPALARLVGQALGRAGDGHVDVLPVPHAAPRRTGSAAVPPASQQPPPLPVGQPWPGAPSTGSQPGTGATGTPLTGAQPGTGATGTSPTGAQVGTGATGIPPTAAQTGTGATGTPPTGAQVGTGATGIPPAGDQPGTVATGTPPTGAQPGAVATGSTLPGEPSPQAAPSGPTPAGGASPAGTGAEAGVAATADPYQLGRPRFMAGSGMRVFHVFGTEQVGPALEVELGVMRRNYRLGGLYRAYLGENTSHFLGMRFEGGPRWGRFRLSMGLDFGFVFTPDMGTAVDMMTIGAELAGVTFQVWHVELHLSAFNLDLYLVMADSLGEADLEPWIGFNSGFSAAFFF